MRILIATDGTLPIEPTVAHVARLHQTGDSITVMTAVNLPRDLLVELGAALSPAPIEDVVEAAGHAHFGLGGGDRVAERLGSAGRPESRPLDAALERYHAKIESSCVNPLVDALADAGITAQSLVRETENRTAATVIDACRERRIDLLVMGSTGRGRFEGLVGSTSTKLFRHAPCDVLLIRVPSD